MFPGRPAVPGAHDTQGKAKQGGRSVTFVTFRGISSASAPASDSGSSRCRWRAASRGTAAARSCARPDDRRAPPVATDRAPAVRSDEHTSELQSLMRNPYAVFCLKKKNKTPKHQDQLNQYPT